ncbi:hypothetical protein QMZ05_31285 [Bradyrhizobium sp. INPA03-11B]|uniref:hypothetical protein n=1 Tax=Bradyrhizobium sp. INPA03-11B TaxID=418598 RepID=UPI003390566B
MKHADHNEIAKAAALDFAHRLAPRWRMTLGNDFLGAYMIGSVAHAGFSWRYSDVDMALVTAAGISPGTLDRIRSEAVALSPDWGAKVSVFWADGSFSCGRFPPLDRVDFLDHAIPLLEYERVRPVRPGLNEIRHYLRGTPFASWVEFAKSFAAAETLERKDHKAYLRTLLYPARLCYSWMTGRMGSNDGAVAFLSERNAAGLDVNLIKRALQCRQAAADPDELFSARTMLLSQIDACAALLAT